MGMQTACQVRREKQVSEVVARFEREHLELSASVATEKEGRCTAERETVEIRARLAELRHRAQEAWPSPLSPHSTLVQYKSRDTQTESEVAGPPSLEREALAFRVADLEAKLWAGAHAEEARLVVVEEHMRRALALKNDMIDE